MAFPRDANPHHPTEIDRLRVAFAVFVAKRIVDADGILDLSEIQLLTMAFPNPWMSTCGFLDSDTNLLPACAEAYEDARKILPLTLDLEEKLELVSLFHRTCMADGELHEREFAILLEAAQELAVPRDKLREHLATIRCGGTLVPPVRLD